MLKFSLPQSAIPILAELQGAIKEFKKHSRVLANPDISHSVAVVIWVKREETKTNIIGAAARLIENCQFTPPCHEKRGGLPAMKNAEGSLQGSEAPRTGGSL